MGVLFFLGRCFSRLFGDFKKLWVNQTLLSWAEREGSIVSNNGAVGVKLQDRGWALRRNVAVAHVVNGLGLVLAAGHNQNAAREHDGLRAHGVSLARDVLHALKQAAVCLNSALGEVNAVRTLGEMVVRLVEANVTVVTNTKKLQVRIASLSNKPIVLGASCLDIRIRAVGHMSVLKINIYQVKEVFAHEIVIALRIVVRKTAVLVKVIRRNLRKVQVSPLAPISELSIGANWR